VEDREVVVGAVLGAREVKWGVNGEKMIWKS